MQTTAVKYLVLSLSKIVDSSADIRNITQLPATWTWCSDLNLV